MVTDTIAATPASPIAGHERCVDIAIAFRERMDALDVASYVLAQAIGDFVARERLDTTRQDDYLIERARTALERYECARAMPGWPEAVTA